MEKMEIQFLNQMHKIKCTENNFSSPYKGTDFRRHMKQRSQTRNPSKKGPLKGKPVFLPQITPF